MWWGRAAAVALVAAVLVAGCSDPPSAAPAGSGEDDAQVEVAVSESKGALRGVVTDERIVPVPGVTVELSGGPSNRTGDDGTFAFSLLDPGAYVVTASKLGYASASTTVSVQAGVDPGMTRLQIALIPGKSPYVSQFHGEGFYECALEINTPALVFTDSCDFPLKYGYDNVNSTGVPPPAPRSIQQSVNRWEFDIAGDVETYVQEMTWDDPAVTMLMRGCEKDLSDLEEPCGGRIFLHVEGPDPLIGRLGLGEIPRNATAYHFGALSFVDGAQYALNFRFNSFVTLFHNFEAPPGWSFLAGDAAAPP